MSPTLALLVIAGVTLAVGVLLVTWAVKGYGYRGLYAALALAFMLIGLAAHGVLISDKQERYRIFEAYGLNAAQLDGDANYRQLIEQGLMDAERLSRSSAQPSAERAKNIAEMAILVRGWHRESSLLYARMAAGGLAIAFLFPMLLWRPRITKPQATSATSGAR